MILVPERLGTGNAGGRTRSVIKKKQGSATDLQTTGVFTTRTSKGAPHVP